MTSRERSATRAGYVVLLGAANVGKSTLLNRILGEKVTITSPKPQTTRRRVTGILTQDNLQAVFVDTPGLLDPGYALQQALSTQVDKALEGVDVAVVVRDATAGEPDPAASARESHVLRRLHRTPRLLALNKVDRLTLEDTAERAERARTEAVFDEVHAVSAVTGAGIEALVEAVLSRLPESAFFFEPEQLSDRTMRFLAAELVRETLFEQLGQELPYSSHVEVVAFEEDREVPRVEAVIYVERESQKGMVIGRGGEALKRIGTAARQKIEAMAGGQIFLQLRVKVRPNWRRRDVELRRFGYFG